MGLLIYARGRPLWSAARPDEILPPLDEGDRDGILRGNAAALSGAQLSPVA